MVEAGFKYGLSAGSLSSTKVGTYSNGSISASLTGLTAGTTYYYQAYAIVKGTGDKESTRQTFYGSTRSLSTKWTYLNGYEVSASSATESSRSQVSETYGNTKASVYSTSNSMQKVVTHTFSHNNKVKRNYTMLYDGNKKCALWVAYVMHATEYAHNSAGRSDAWAYDPAISQSWQFNGGYAESTTYDRGHQMASNDRQTTEEANQQTFYYTNMTPQFGSLNRGQWQTLEGKVQSLAASTTGRDSLYVVTGPIFNSPLRTTTDKSGATVGLPDGYYKCLMKCSFDTNGQMTSAHGTAFLFDTNSSNIAPTQTTIDAIETKTGFNFFSNVPDSIENQAESEAYHFWL